MCLANLSSDEVFTPPKIANDMLDFLPQELFTSPHTKFLDPACKSGVFLREIVKRLIKGLTEEIPDLQERVNHIMRNQVYGIAVTDLTAMMTRRTVYCSMNVQSKFSVCKFDNDEGNIRFRECGHNYVKGKCKFCGASEKNAKEGEESHAYEFIHTVRPEEILGMKFDVVISNPPYQLNVGVEKENYAVPIYHKFVEQAKKLNPEHIVMIIPARWYAGGRGLDDFRESMLKNKHIRELHDYPNSAECFPGVDLAGGVCYFHWKRDEEGDCTIITHSGDNISEMTRPLIEKGINSFIRQNEAITILRKVRNFNEKTFAALVSPQTPFGLITSFRDFEDEPFEGCVKYYTYGHVGYIKLETVRKNADMIAKHKVYISAAYGERGKYPFYFLGKPFYGQPYSCCSQTYLVIGPFDDKETCDNVISYITTKFFRFLVMLKKNAQHNMSYVFELVPVQDFSRSWTDPELYDKYGLTDDEIAFIDSMIRPMNTEDSQQ